MGCSVYLSDVSGLLAPGHAPTRTVVTLNFIDDTAGRTGHGSSSGADHGSDRTAHNGTGCCSNGGAGGLLLGSTGSG
jgi:hypothetical protein